MRLLTLIRHAKSSWDDPLASDFDRTLNERGQRDAPRMATHVVRSLSRPDRIVSSPAVRALTTARIFADAWALGTDAFTIQPRIYDASVETLLRVVHGLDDADRHIVMFGHNPGFTELAHTLTRCSFDDMPTCAVVQLGFDARKSWGELTEMSGAQRFYAYPKQFREST